MTVADLIRHLRGLPLEANILIFRNDEFVDLNKEHFAQALMELRLPTRVIPGGTVILNPENV